MTNSDPITRHSIICAELNFLYAKKNADYGDSFHQQFVEDGMEVARVKLSDKLNRFRNLTRDPSKQQVKDESIRDSLIDLANYAIMTIMEIDGGQE